MIVDEASNMMALRSRGVTTLLIVVTLSTCIADPQQDIDDKDYFDRYLILQHKNTVSKKEK